MNKNIYREILNVFNNEGFFSWLCSERSLDKSEFTERYKKINDIISNYYPENENDIIALKLYLESEINSTSNLLNTFICFIGFIGAMVTIVMDKSSIDKAFIYFTALVNFVLLIVMITVSISDKSRSKKKYIVLVINEFLNNKHNKESQ